MRNKHLKALLPLSVAAVFVVVFAVFGGATKKAGFAAEDAAGHDESHGHDHDAHEHAEDDADEHGEDDAHEHDHGHDEKLVRLSHAEQEALGIQMRTASPGVLRKSLTLPAEVRIDEDRMAHVVPRVSGIVREVHKCVGDKVAEGEVMAVLDSRELADAQAEYLAAKARLVLAQREFAREKSLWEEEISSEKDYLVASGNLEEARIHVDAAQQKLTALGLSNDDLAKSTSAANKALTRYEMTAPFPGEVLDRHIVLGEALDTQSVAFVIADLDSVWVDVKVYEKDVLRIHKGQRVKVSRPKGISPAEGTITYVAPVVDKETRTILARIVLPNKERRWRPGLFLDVTLSLEGAQAAITVPKTAVQQLENVPVVFVEAEEGFQAIAVELGAGDERSVEVLSGLHERQRFVVRGAFELKAKLVTSDLGAHAGHGH